MANMYNYVTALLDVDTWVEYVASAANIADIPSRLGNRWEPRHEDWDKLHQMGFEEREMCFPSELEWSNMALMERRLRARP